MSLNICGNFTIYDISEICLMPGLLALILHKLNVILSKLEEVIGNDFNSCIFIYSLCYIISNVPAISYLFYGFNCT